MNIKSLKKKRILITGAHGFLGHHLTRNLKAHGYQHLYTPKRTQYDLTKRSQIERLFRNIKPQVVIHLAARVGGILANRDNPGLFFYENMVMGLELIEASRIKGVEKFVALGTVCAYPKFAKVPFKEADIWKGYPEETNAPYGLAKKMLLVQSQAYRENYGFNSIYLLPVNMYGPGDHFDPRISHVIPALIRKFTEAKRRRKKEVVIWGDGTCSREFLYVEDSADGIRLALEKYDKAEPVNIGTGKETTIRDLAKMIKSEIGFQGRIRWDRSKPNGQPRRCLDVSRAKKEFGFRAKTPLKVGLKRTIDWFLDRD